MNHHKEPWSLNRKEVVCATDAPICTMHYEPPIAQANAQRIIECVNALAGVAHPAATIDAVKTALINAWEALVFDASLETKNVRAAAILEVLKCFGVKQETRAERQRRELLERLQQGGL